MIQAFFSALMSNLHLLFSVFCDEVPPEAVVHEVCGRQGKQALLALLGEVDEAGLLGEQKRERDNLESGFQK